MMSAYDISSTDLGFPPYTSFPLRVLSSFLLQEGIQTLMLTGRIRRIIPPPLHFLPSSPLHPTLFDDATPSHRFKNKMPGFTAQVALHFVCVCVLLLKYPPPPPPSKNGTIPIYLSLLEDAPMAQVYHDESPCKGGPLDNEARVKDDIR